MATALDLFARRPIPGFRTGLRFLDGPDALGAGAASARASASGPDATAQAGGFRVREIVELQGHPTTVPLGLLLSHVVAAFLIRRSECDSAGEMVYVFDHEGGGTALPPALLFQVLCRRFEALGSHLQEQKARARRAMTRVVVYRSRDTFQWLATLNNLHFRLLDAPPTPFLLVVHGIGAFVPMDMALAKTVGDGLALMDDAFVLLKEFIRHHSPFVVTTKCVDAPPSTVATSNRSGRSTMDPAEWMPTSWSSQVARRIHIQKVSRIRESQDVEMHDKEPPNDMAQWFEARCIAREYSRTFPIRLVGLDFEEDGVGNDRAGSPRNSTVNDTTDHAETEMSAAELWMR